MKVIEQIRIIPENIDIVQGIMDNDAKGLVVTAREADWNKLPDDFQMA